jgi:Asp-tRNA(Asn)/Glu-tRNA(Gln) amidotransferase B subunit
MEKNKLLTRKDLAVIYHISLKTIQRRLKEHYSNQRYFTEADLSKIHALIIQKSGENQS